MREQFTVLNGGNLIDGRGGDPVENGIVVIKNNYIEAVGTIDSTNIPEGSRIIDTTGKTVMPGLIEAHIHLFGIKSMDLMEYFIDPSELRAMRVVLNAWKLVDSGFTTARECGSPNGLFLKTAIEEESIIGPRILACGGIISQTGGYGQFFPSTLPIDWEEQKGPTQFADGVEECRKIVRNKLRAGADFIKIASTGGVMMENDHPETSRFTAEELKVIVDEAHNSGAKVACQIQGTQQWIEDLLSVGVDTLEHGYYLEDDVIEKIAEQGTYLMPTLAIAEAIVRHGSSSGLPEAMVSELREARDRSQRVSFEKACKAGIKIGCGSNYAYDPFAPIGENARELELQIDGGRSPMDVLVSATKINAEALGIDDKLGTLEAGKLADIIVVDGDPIKDITVLQDATNIVKVYKEGREIPRLR